MMKTTVMKVAVLAVAAVAIWLTWAAVRARSNLVTLNVRNADVRDVVRKIEWQTWELIVVRSNVEGKVTLNVEKVPLEEVLGIVGEQVGARWTAMYPLYSTSRSLKNFKRALRGEVVASDNGWTNLQARGVLWRGGGGGGMFADNARGDNNHVSAVFESKDLSVATLALSRFGPIQVVPEDGTEGYVNLKLDQVPIDDAVAQLARSVRRDWTKYYALQGFRFGGGRRDGQDGQDRERAGFRGGPPPDSPMAALLMSDGSTNLDSNAVGAAWEERRTNLQQMIEAQLDTMPPDQRQQAMERLQRFQEMRNLSPEERRQRFEGMAQSPEIQARIQDRMMRGLKNTTPEQRVERDQRRLQMIQRFEQGGAPGPGR